MNTALLICSSSSSLEVLKSSPLILFPYLETLRFGRAAKLISLYLLRNPNSVEDMPDYPEPLPILLLKLPYRREILLIAPSTFSIELLESSIVL